MGSESQNEVSLDRVRNESVACQSNLHGRMLPENMEKSSAKYSEHLDVKHAF